MLFILPKAYQKKNGDPKGKYAYSQYNLKNHLFRVIIRLDTVF